MSRNRNNRNMSGYNRPSGGYQKNLYRQKLKEENIKAPKSVDAKKLRYILIGAGVVWLIVTIILIINFRWIGLLIGLGIGIIGVGSAYLYLRYKQREIITYYKKVGMTEEMYINELKKRNTNPKEIAEFRKIWRKIKVD